MSSLPLKKPLFFVLKVSISFLLLYWILKNVDLETVWQHLKKADVKYLFFVPVFVYTAQALMTLRCLVLCRMCHINISFLFLFRSLIIAASINHIAPSSIGGDVYRIYDIYKKSGSTREATSIILIDRIIGVVPLIVISLIAALFTDGLTETLPELPWFFAAVFFIPSVILWMVFSNTKLKWLDAERLHHFKVMHKLITNIDNAIVSFRGRKDILIKNILLSFVSQLIMLFAFVFIAMALKIDLSLSTLIAIITLTAFVILLPISLNGLGIREAALIFLFGLYGVSETTALAFAWLWLAMLIIEGLVGVLMFLTRRSQAR